LAALEKFYKVWLVACCVLRGQDTQPSDNQITVEGETIHLSLLRLFK